MLRNNETPAVLYRDRETGEAVQRILGINTDAWSDCEIQFETGDHATAKVTFILSGKQLVELAQLTDRDPSEGE